MKYAFVQRNAQDFPVKKLCQILKLSRSAYYAWNAKGTSVVPAEELVLRRRMKALFAESRQSLGSRMMSQQLRTEGLAVGRDKARRRMKDLELKVKSKRRFKLTTDSRHAYPLAPNVLNRAFYPTSPNRVWASDITFLWTLEGWVYLAVVIDLYSRRVVGWAMDRRMKKALVIRAFMMAINLRQPPKDLIHHSDRGSQYACTAYQRLLWQHNMIPSMSRKGNCWDNAVVERFFSSLKREWTRDQLYPTRQAVITDVREYIAVYYNARRLHSTLGYKTPMHFENTA